jgi:hypothetical protein
LNAVKTSQTRLDTVQAKCRMIGAACPRAAQPGRTRWAQPSEEEQPGRPGAAQPSSRDGLARHGTWPTGPTGAQLPAGGSRPEAAQLAGGETLLRSRDGPAGMKEVSAHPGEDTPACTGFWLCRPVLTGKLLFWPRICEFRPEKARFDICRPVDVNSAGKHICQLGECRSQPWPHICQSGHKYASRDINMPARGSLVPAR